MLKLLRLIRQVSETVPISLEVSPPRHIELPSFKELIRLGVIGFSVNLEIWNGDIRRKICPGKSAISKEDYFKTWEYLVDKVGPFSISSALIIGLEPLKEEIEGILEMVGMGVKPALIPLRPFVNGLLSDRKPPDPKILEYLSGIAAEEMVNRGFRPEQLRGCEACGGCTIEGDMAVLKCLGY